MTTVRRGIVLAFSIVLFLGILFTEAWADNEQADESDNPRDALARELRITFKGESGFNNVMTSYNVTFDNSAHNYVILTNNVTLVNCTHVTLINVRNQILENYYYDVLFGHLRFDPAYESAGDPEPELEPTVLEKLEAKLAGLSEDDPYTKIFAEFVELYRNAEDKDDPDLNMWLRYFGMHDDSPPTM